MDRTPTRERSKLRIVGAILSAWLVGGLIAGGLGGIREAISDPGPDVPALHVAWRAFGSAVAAAACGLAALPIVWPLLTSDRAILIGILPIFVGQTPFAREDFLQWLISVAVPMGLILGVVLRVLLEPSSSRARPRPD